MKGSMARSGRTFIFEIDFSERSSSARKSLLFPISTHFRARKLSNVRFWRKVSVFGVLCKIIGDSMIELNEHWFWKPVSQNNHRSSNTFSHYLQLSKTGRHWVLTLRNGHETVARGEKQRWCYVVGMYLDINANPSPVGPRRKNVSIFLHSEYRWPLLLMCTDMVVIKTLRKPESQRRRTFRE